jgi:F0F1-type ATP synthase assembly protein I
VAVGDWYISRAMAPDQDNDNSSNGDSQAKGWGQGSNVAWSIIGTLLAGMIAWGGIGLVIDLITGASLFLPFGVLVGLAGALFLIVRRYGGG